MTPDEKIEILKADVNSLQTQMNMLNPAAYIEFKGQVLATLKSIVETIEEMRHIHTQHSNLNKDAADKQETVLKDMNKAISDNEANIKAIRGQATVIAFIVPIIVSIIIAIIKLI